MKYDVIVRVARRYPPPCTIANYATTSEDPELFGTARGGRASDYPDFERLPDDLKLQAESTSGLSA